MSADLFLELATQLVFLAVFATTVVAAFRRPLPATRHVALFFAAIAAIILIGDASQIVADDARLLLAQAQVALLGFLPWLLVRLAADFTAQPAGFSAAAGIVASGLAVGAFLVGQPVPLWFAALPVTAFVGFGGYASLAFLRGARSSRGVTSRRLTAVAAGGGLLGLALLLALARALIGGPGDEVQILVRLVSLAAGLAYFVGFSPPRILRRAWQEPELRSFLGRAASLPRLPDTSAIVAELTRGAAEATGAPYASIGLWDPDREVLVYERRNGGVLEAPPDEYIAGRAFSRQEPVLADDAASADPVHADVYRETGAEAVLAAPITAGERRLGVLVVYAPRAPIFAADDLELVRLLGDQAAVILESRALIDEAARLQAREEATRLKDDFLSAAAHDLRTPLTALLMNAELLERQRRRAPDSPPDERRVTGVLDQARRLQQLVNEYLDITRLESDGFQLDRQPADLAALVAEVADGISSRHHAVTCLGEGSVPGAFDVSRIDQLLRNLAENAVKYSPAGGEVRLKAWTEGAEARVSVSDQGIGIPPADMGRLFERYQRGSNVTDRDLPGVGLGLYICRLIVERHGGRIWAESELGRGTTVHVALPREEVPLDAG